MNSAARALLGAFLTSLVSCSTVPSAGPCTPGGDGSYRSELYEDLAQFCVVDLRDGAVVPTDASVVPYDVNSPLFSDYATKARAIWLPPGTRATYRADDVLDLPVGTILTKSFGFPRTPGARDGKIQWVETRVLARGDEGWLASSYVWDDAQEHASRRPGGTVRDIDVTTESGEIRHASYLVPGTTQCGKCHERDAKLLPIGVRASGLNRDFAYPAGVENQLAHWASRGALEAVPNAPPKLAVWNDPATGDASTRARAYLDANCSYCHSPVGEARTTGLFLSIGETDPVRLGRCKQPVAAGRAASNLSFDLVPGKPDESILLSRMLAVEPSIAMPELGRSLVHTEAVALVRDWIAAMPGTCTP